MGSSLPRHGVGVRTKTQEKEQNKTKQNQKKKKKNTPRANCKLAQKIYIYIYRNNNLYNSWTDKFHDACSNAVITSSILSLESQNWLEYRVYNKNPKILKNHLFNLY